MSTYDGIVKELDVQALAERRRRHLSLVIATGIFGGGLYGYTLSALSGALVSLNFGGELLTSWEQGVITAAMLLGAALGSYFGGSLADKFGRRWLIVIGAFLAIPGAAGCAAAQNMAVLTGSRALIGLAIGITSVVIPLYIGEMASSKQRGTLVSVNSVMINVGQLIAVGVNAIIALFGDWRAMLWAGVVPAILLFLCALFVRDTPNYFARHGMDIQAVRLLLETRSEDEARDTFNGIEEGVAQDVQEAGSKKRGSFSAPWLRRVLVVGIGVAMINQLTGVNVINYYAPTIFSKTLGFDATNSVLALVPVMVISTVAAIIGGLGFIDRVNRRSILSLGLTGVAVFLGAVGVTYLFIDPTNPSIAISWLLIVLIMIYLVFMQGMVSPSTWLLIAEVFPSRVRGKGMGYANVAMNATNFVISLFFPVVLDAIGGAASFLIFAAINVISLIFTRKMVPETRGKSLEQIEAEARAHAN